MCAGVCCACKGLCVCGEEEGRVWRGIRCRWCVTTDPLTQESHSHMRHIEHHTLTRSPMRSLDHPYPHSTSHALTPTTYTLTRLPMTHSTSHAHSLNHPYPPIHSLDHPCTHSTTHTHTCILCTHSATHALTRQPIPTHALTHSLTHSLTRSLTHSLTD